MQLMMNADTRVNSFSRSIVFIHGPTGDREESWTAPGASEPWPETLLPTEIPTARILLFGYDAIVTKWQDLASRTFISSYALSLLKSLATYREDDNTVYRRRAGRMK